MPLPSLKGVGTLLRKGIEALPEGALLKEFLPKREEKPMVFEIGEGLSDKQQKLAKEKIRQLQTTGKTFPSSLDKAMSQEDAWRITTNLLAKKKSGEALTSYDMAAGDEAGRTLADFATSAILGFFTPNITPISNREGLTLMGIFLWAFGSIAAGQFDATE